MKTFDIGQVDENLRVTTGVGDKEVVFYDVRTEPQFDLYGLYNPRGEAVFRRMPRDVAAQCNEGVLRLHTNTSGARVRFSTNSPYIAIRTVYPTITHMTHMAMVGSSGFDLYADDPDRDFSTLIDIYKPPKDMTDGYTSLVTTGDGEERCYTLHFPLYNNVDALYIGLAPGATLGHGKPYRLSEPIVYFGSSITQGGCASRPGNSYPNIVTRRLGLDHVNLGFSGSGRAEPAMREYIASLPMCAFVCDYDHNARDVNWLRDTHYPLYKAVRDAHPDIPILLMTRPDILPKDTARNFGFAECRRVILNTYDKACDAGDRNVYFLDGTFLYGRADRDLCTVDGVHANDYGFAKMAEQVTELLDVAFHQTWNKK